MIDFLDYLRLLAAYGFTREQVASMPPERIARLLSACQPEPGTVSAVER